MTDNLYLGATERANYQLNTFMRTQLLKKLSVLMCLGLALFGINHRALGQLSVGPSGLAPQTFDALPLVAEWSTLSVGPGNVPGGAISTGAQMDSVVQSNAGTRVSLTLPTSSTVPPAASGFAQWNSTGQYLQTRANTNWYTLLMATLRNNTGSNIVSLTVNYNLATAAGTVSEQVPGHRAYYSFTGATGTWIRIPAFDSPTGIDNSSKSALLDLGFWAANAPLYLLWSDANAAAVSTSEGAYSIDNFAVTAIPSQPGPPVITVQPQSQTVGFPNSVTFSVNANGTVPFFYQWFKNGTSINGATNSTYTINNATLVDQGSYSVVVSNSLGTVTSGNATLTVTCSAGAPPTIATQPADQSLNSGGTLSLSVTASGTGPFAYQWYRSGSLIPGATSAAYNKVNAQDVDSGLYTVVVKNCNGPVTSREAVVSIGGAGYVLMGLTNYFWKYEQSGTDLGTGWRTNGYNDTAWPSGRGLFAFEDNGALTPLINTPLTLGSPQKITYYFRTTFVLSNDPATVTLVSSNYFDDGAIVYVNGKEAFRYNMPGGNVLYGTVALAANPANEGVFIISNIPSSVLVQGTNLVAVEVHQNSSTSSDIDFGMALFVNPIAPSPLSITNQPQSLIAEETKSATFTVGVQGAPAYYQWYRDGVAVSNGTSNPFTIPVVSANDAGCYHVVVTNAINSVTSAPCALLTVIADTNAPTIVDADGTISSTNVLVTFSELVLPSFATNTANYKITNTLGGTLIITNAVLQNGSNVLLRTTTSRGVGSNYILIVNNVRDVSTRQNVIVPNSMFPIRSLVSLIALDGAWKFVDPYPPFDIDPGSVGSAWKGLPYDETIWSDGNSIFWLAPDSSVISGPLGTQLSETPGLTTYFRNTFQLRASPGGLQFFLTHLIDDGAVFYLNGAEIYRFNMPAGVVITSTPPAAVIGNVVREGPFVLPVSSIRQGSNVLAAELHQPAGADTDKVFGIELQASVQSFVVGPVIITGGPRNVCIAEGQQVTLSAEQAGGATFQWQQNNSNIPGATNASYTIPNVLSTMAGAQFRVVISNATSTATSTNATLCVTADTNKPALLGALLTTNGTVVVSFSEQMSAGSAVTSNYRITNSAGANIAITGAALSGGNSNVVLTLGSSSGGGFILIVSNVQDRATVPNTISPNPSVARIGFEGPFQLLPIAGTWKYEQSGTDLGTTWRNVGYNDSAWPSGQALLAVEDGATAEPIRTTLVLSNGVAPQTLTYYFRTTVVSPIGGSARLRLRMEIDDGGVFYLNGAEILRVRIADGVNVVYATLAGGPPAEGVFETYDVVVTNLVAGNNVIAVEVHQTSATSTDIVFGSDLTLLGVESTVIPQVQITTQPQSRTNAVGTTASFTVAATGGTPLRYQWRRNAVNISSTTNPTATNATLVLTNVQLGDNGTTYSVVVTDPASSATSSAATLTVTGGGCQSTSWTSNLTFATNGSNWVSATRNGNVTTTVLSWTNPATNTCGSNAVVVLQRALTLGNVYPVPSTLWTNIYTNVFGYARVTNSVTNSNEAYYRLRVP